MPVLCPWWRRRCGRESVYRLTSLRRGRRIGGPLQGHHCRFCYNPFRGLTPTATVGPPLLGYLCTSSINRGFLSGIKGTVRNFIDVSFHTRILLHPQTRIVAVLAQIKSACSGLFPYFSFSPQSWQKRAAASFGLPHLGQLFRRDVPHSGQNLASADTGLLH